MKTRFNLSRFGLLLLAVLLLSSFTGFRLIRVALRTNTSDTLVVVSVVLGLMWFVTIAHLAFWPLVGIIAFPIKRYRRFPILYWVLLLIYVVDGVVIWILLYQPVWGKIGAWSQFYILIWGWMLIFVLGYDFDRAQLKELIAKVENNRAKGVMISLTVILMLLLGVEMRLRLFFIRSDSTFMTLSGRHWLELNWKPINPLGYRDSCPTFPHCQLCSIYGE